MNNEKKFIKLTPFKMQVLQSFPFIDEDFDAITNYELLCKVVEYLNKTVDNVDLLNEKVEEFENYFDNLDVQEEINNKLDEMAEDGTLAEIINQELFSEMNAQIQTNTEDIEEINYYKLPHGTAEEIENFISQRKGVGHVFYADGLYELDRPITVYENQIYDFEGNESSDTTLHRELSRMETIKIIGTGSEQTIFKATNANSLFNPQTENSTHYNIAFEFENISFVGDGYKNTPFDLSKDDSRTFRLRFTNCNFNNWNYGFYYDYTDGNSEFRGRFLTFNNCYFTANNYGLFVSQDNVELNQCQIEYNDYKGIIIQGSHVFNMNGGKVQYNGKNKEDGNQIIITTGSNTINFNGVYIEPSSSSDINTNIDTSLITLSKSNIGSVITSVNFTNCRINGIGSSYVININNEVTMYSLNLDNINLTNFRINDNKELVKCDNTNINLIGLKVTGCAINISDLNGTSIANNILIPTSFTNARNVVNGLKNNIISSPLNKGETYILAGSVNADASQKYYNSDNFTVTKEDTGVYLITLNVASKNLGNTSYFPVIATAQNTSNHAICTVESVSSSSFRIRTIKPDTNTAIDNAFRFVAVLNI